MLSSDKISKLQKIAKRYNLQVLILFGSRSKNNHTSKSDWDLAYFAKKPLGKTKKELWNDIEDVLSPNKVDLIELNTSYSIILRYEIFSKGICIYESKEGLFSDLEGDAWIDYQDNKSYFKECKNLLKESIEEL